MSPQSRCLAGIIRERRTELGLTTDNVAEALHQRTSSLVDRIERGFRACPLDCIPDLARVLQLDQKELCRFALREAAPIFYATLFGFGEPQRPTPVDRR